MRTPLGGLFLAALFLGAGCGASPRRAVVDTVPMYSAGEWQAMNADVTVPEIPDHSIPSGFVVGSFEDYSSVPARGPVDSSANETRHPASLGSSHFSMHIHTHSFHMHMHH